MSAEPITDLTDALDRYLELMYTADTAAYDDVFAPTARLHGLRDGKLVMLSNEEFRALLAGRPSPQALGAPREQAILGIDVASPDQAVAKVRVRIGATQFVDQLSYHRIDGGWRITAKSFHIERTYPSATAT